MCWAMGEWIQERIINDDDGDKEGRNDLNECGSVSSSDSSLHWWMREFILLRQWQ